MMGLLVQQGVSVHGCGTAWLYTNKKPTLWNLARRASHSWSNSGSTLLCSGASPLTRSVEAHIVEGVL